MIDQKAKDAFWQVVEDCLIEIHGLAQPNAHSSSQDLRTRIESPPVIFYHAEPFDVACDIAGKQLDLSTYRPQYDAIVTRHNW